MFCCETFQGDERRREYDMNWCDLFWKSTSASFPIISQASFFCIFIPAVANLCCKQNSLFPPEYFSLKLPHPSSLKTPDGWVWPGLGSEWHEDRVRTSVVSTQQYQILIFQTRYRFHSLCVQYMENMLRPDREMYGCHKRHSANCKLIISSLVHPPARH